jgi:hypothetical protein
MPRKARIDAPGAVHHIMARGIEGRKIFRNDDDRNEFLERLEPTYALKIQGYDFDKIVQRVAELLDMPKIGKGLFGNSMSRCRPSQTILGPTGEWCVSISTQRTDPIEPLENKIFFSTPIVLDL